MITTNFKRVLIQVLTVEDLRTPESRARLLKSLDQIQSQDTQVAGMQIIAAEDTLEQLVVAVPRNVLTLWLDRDLGITSQTEALEGASHVMGMDKECPAMQDPCNCGLSVPARCPVHGMTPEKARYTRQEGTF